MSSDNQEPIQILNTAIIKSRKKKLDYSYEEKLLKACELPSIKSLAVAITHLSETERISRDQAAVRIVETIRELDNIWSDYMMMEGMSKFKSLFKDRERP